MPQRDLTSKHKNITQSKFSELSSLNQKKLSEYETYFDTFRKTVFQSLIAHEFPAIDKVDDNIWIGTVLAAVDPVLLRKLGISHIINMAKDEEYHDYKDVDDIHVTRYGIYDGHLSPDMVFHAVADEIKTIVEANNNVLVHCSAGVSRSATAVLTYLMLHKNMPFDAALKALQSKRGVVSPHPLLVRSLIRDFKSKFTW